MKNWSLITIGGAVLSAVSVFAQTTQSTRENVVDFKAANPVLSSILEVVTHTDDLVDFAYPKFDEAFSSVAKERIKYSVDAALKNTPWKEGSFATVKGEATFKVVHAGQPGIALSGITIEASSLVKADIFSMLQYGGYIAMKKVRPHEYEYERVMGHLRRLSKTRSFEDLNEILVSSIALSKDIVNNSEIKREKDFLKALEAGIISSIPPDQVPQQILRIKQKIKDLEESLVAIGKIKIQLILENGKAVGLDISSPDVAAFFNQHHGHSETLEIKSGTLRLTHLSAEGRGVVFAKSPDDRLARLKSKFTTRLQGVVAGTPNDMTKMDNDYRHVLLQLKRFIRGEIDN